MLEGGCMSRFRLVFGLFVAGLVVLPSIGWAQSVIVGSVTDTSGGVLPGGTGEAKSRALIEGSKTAVTNERGEYRIIDLRPGTYSVTATLPGFNTVVREGISLSTDFTATVAFQLGVSAVQETVTVSGAAPVVDV